MLHIVQPTNKVKDEYVSISSYGQNATLQCPVVHGALFQAYRVEWNLTTVNSSFPEYEISANLTSYLDLYDIQEENLGTYSCVVTVTNPYDDKVWTVTGANFHLSSE